MNEPGLEGASPIEQVLDLARWAPSGDNTQPWRFQLIDATSCIVHAFDTRDHCVYDLTGAPSQISVGAMLETARIAASGLGMRVQTRRQPESPDAAPRFHLRLVPDGSIEPSALIPHIKTRSTFRRPLSRRPLSESQKKTLETSVGSDYRLTWLEGSQRSRVAKLMFQSAKIRLSIKEAYEVHASVIEWNARFSETKMPDQAIGLDPVGLAIMRWAMKSWGRADFLGRYLGGTLLPRLQLDLLPGIGCAAHFVIVGERPAQNIDDYVRAGAAVQRLWLTAESMGLRHQPEMTPLIFADYVRKGIRFSTQPQAMQRAREVSSRLDAILGAGQVEKALWMGRLGFGPRAAARSTRRPLSGLLTR